ncbi:dihydrodipicolinate synthase family protein [Amycolatopsis sp. WAC 01416]|nr:dihydrodipicolinate synthase family protein [Amycolatopsis sp. WAC 01416]
MAKPPSRRCPPSPANPSPGADVVIELPEPDGTLAPYEPSTVPRGFTPSNAPFTSRVVFSTAHVVADPMAANTTLLLGFEPFRPPAIDWDATIAFRGHLWAQGFAVAEALDTQNRAMGLDWSASAELIRRSAQEAHAVGGRIAGGVWTDQLDPMRPHSIADITAAYEEQIEFVEGVGAQTIIMASPQLAQTAASPDDYAAVYRHLLAQATTPVILHWVLPESDPRLAGYWGHTDWDAALDAFAAVVKSNVDKVDGVKVWPVSREREIQLRRVMPEGVHVYNGDITDFPELIEGDEQGHSDALASVFGPLAPVIAGGFRALDAGDTETYRAELKSTLPLAQHLFEGDALSMRFFKTGFVFLAWLSGHQEHFRMIWGEQSARSVPHLAKAYRLADGLGLFPDADLAEHRMRLVLETAGIR